MVATSALGMGYDKPDLAFVVHYQSPGSADRLLPAGRPGRARRSTSAHGVLLRGHEDRDIQDYFIRTAFPPQEQAEAVVGLLVEAGRRPVIDAEIEAAVNVRRRRIEAMLKVLEVDGAVEARTRGGRTRSRGRTTPSGSRPVTRCGAYEQAGDARLRDDRRVPHGVPPRAARRRPNAGGCPCGRCDNCTGVSAAVELDPTLVASAVQFLRASRLEVEPRRQWPAGIDEAKGRIPKEEQLQVGRALGLIGDGGWGSVVQGLLRSGAADTEVPDEVLEAAVSLIRAWNPTGGAAADPLLTWVPSVARPAVVSSLAQRLGAALGWEVAALVRRVRPMPPQSEMANNAQQVRNVFRAFGIVDPPPGRPVLLVDDVAESRWTLTVVGGQLIRAGSGPVHAFVLAKAGGG